MTLMSFCRNTTTFVLTAVAVASCAADQPYLRAPSIETYAHHNPSGLTILSNGRYLKPVGRHLAVTQFPYGLAISPDGKTLFVASDGVGQVITGWREQRPAVAVLQPPDSKK